MVSNLLKLDYFLSHPCLEPERPVVLFTGAQQQHQQQGQPSHGATQRALCPAGPLDAPARAGVSYYHSSFGQWDPHLRQQLWPMGPSPTAGHYFYPALSSTLQRTQDWTFGEAGVRVGESGVRVWVSVVSVGECGCMCGALTEAGVQKKEGEWLMRKEKRTLVRA